MLILKVVRGAPKLCKSGGRSLDFLFAEELQSSIFAFWRTTECGQGEGKRRGACGEWREKADRNRQANENRRSVGRKFSRDSEWRFANGALRSDHDLFYFGERASETVRRDKNESLYFCDSKLTKSQSPRAQKPRTGHTDSSWELASGPPARLYQPNGRGMSKR